MFLSRRIFSIISRINRKFLSKRKSKYLLVCLFSKIGIALVSKTVSLLLKIPRSRKYSETLLNTVAYELAKDIKNDSKLIEQLCKFVINEVKIFPLKNIWLSPNDIIRYGIGDCKQKTILLAALLRKNRICANVAVGLIGYKIGKPLFHAWVMVKIRETLFVCDPSVTTQMMTPQEYQKSMNGCLEMTSEYLLSNQRKLKNWNEYLTDYFSKNH